MKETYVGGDIIETTGGNNLSYAKENIENIGEQVIQNGKTNGVAYGTNKKWEGPAEIVSLRWLDENGKPLAKKTINTIEYDAFLYGEKVKAEITFSKNITQEVDLKIRPYFSKKFEQNFKIKPQGTKVTTPLFIIPLDVYDDSGEKYQYSGDSAGKSHYTYYEKELIEHFTVSVVSEVGAKFFDDKKDTLKPYTYFRNYEELVGIFKENPATTYEDKYIKGNSDIEKLVNEFIDFITNKEKIPTEQNINERINADAPKLWKYAVEQVQGGKLDDRPLYWARNKMQTYLKRHPVFKTNIDFEKSTIIKDSNLDKIIKKFEELSRNYTGVDFSKANGKKKLLITGYDPFILNPNKGGNPLQSNPSGVNALALHGKTFGNYYIETFICPVRYADFDDFKNGEGVIETFIKPMIKMVDMIITVSQGDVFRFDVDRFPCKNRGGYMDNMFWGNTSDGFNGRDFKQLTDGKEFYETTLPYEKIVPAKNKDSDTFWIYFNQTYNPDNGGDKNKDIEGTIKRTKYEVIQDLKSYDGSGSNYLSNEIFYRVAKLRTELRKDLPTGHLHIPLTQYGQSFTGPRKNIITKDINPKLGELISEIKKLIEKI